MPTMPEKNLPGILVGRYIQENVPGLPDYVVHMNYLRRQNHARVTHEADCHVKFARGVPLLVERARLSRDLAGAIWMPVPGLFMPSLSPPNRSLSRRTVRLLIAVSVLAALVALPRAHASTAPTAAAAAAPGRPPVAAAAPAAIPVPKTSKAATVASTAPTCRAIMQRLSGSLAATPSTADKPGTVMIDVDKAGVMMACSHSDSIAIPVPGGKPR
ncbi:hypothetical protein [Ralstonia edaphi]|nr:hypothetical protein [Ralstonia sp. LMG 6871]